MDIYELYLINKYNPKYNARCVAMNMELPQKDWIDWSMTYLLKNRKGTFRGREKLEELKQKNMKEIQIRLDRQMQYFDL